jgi:hypothetical protein
MPADPFSAPDDLKDGDRGVLHGIEWIAKPLTSGVRIGAEVIDPTGMVRRVMEAPEEYDDIIHVVFNSGPLYLMNGQVVRWVWGTL